MPQQPYEIFITRPGPGTAEGEIDLGSAREQADRKLTEFIGALLQAAGNGRNHHFMIDPSAGMNALTGRVYGQAYTEEKDQQAGITYRLFNAAGSLILSGVAVDSAPDGRLY